MMDLKSIRYADSAKVEIKDPADGTPTGVVFEIAGPSHPERKKVKFAQDRRMKQRFEKSGRIELPDPEEAESLKHENLAAYTLGWSGYCDEHGKPIPFSKAEAFKLYSDPAMQWLADQIEAAIGEKELFIVRSVTN